MTALRFLSREAPVFVVLSFILSSLTIQAGVESECEIPKSETVQWVIDKCISNSTESVSFCFTTKGSYFNCVGVKNAENCSRAVASLKLSQKVKLEQFDRRSFSYNVESDYLCLQAVVTFDSEDALLFGLDLIVEFYTIDDPDDITRVPLGAIFPSGANNPKQVQESVICAAKPPHIPYDNASFFVSTGYSIPMKVGAGRTNQSEKLSLASLDKISLDEAVLEKDNFNQSQPNIQFPKDYCSKEDDWNVIPVIVIATAVLLVVVCFVVCVLWKKCRSGRRYQPAGPNISQARFVAPETLELS